MFYCFQNERFKIPSYAKVLNNIVDSPMYECNYNLKSTKLNQRINHYFIHSLGYVNIEFSTA